MRNTSFIIQLTMKLNYNKSTITKYNRSIIATGQMISEREKKKRCRLGIEREKEERRIGSWKL